MKLALALVNQAAIALQFTQLIQQPPSVAVRQASEWSTPTKGLQSYPFAGEGLTKRELDQVTNYIDYHLAQGVKLTGLAHVVGMSPSHFLTEAFGDAAGLAQSFSLNH